MPKGGRLQYLPMTKRLTGGIAGGATSAQTASPPSRSRSQRTTIGIDERLTAYPSFCSQISPDVPPGDSVLNVVDRDHDYARPVHQ